jgi:hypothetical protein
MFASKQGFFSKTVLGPAGTPYWIAVFDDFVPEGLDAGTDGTDDYSIIVGTTSTGGNKGQIIKLDTNGNIVFQTQTTGAVNTLSKVIIDPSDNSHVIGSTNENGTARPYAATMDPSGNLVWEKYISNVTSGQFSDITYQTTLSDGVCNSIVGRSNSTPISQFMSFNQANGTLTDQSTYGSVQNILYSITRNPNTGQENLILVGLDTTSSTDDIVVTLLNNNYTPLAHKQVSDAATNLGRPYIWRTESSRFYVTSRYTSGTYGGQPIIMEGFNTPATTLDLSGTKYRLGGTINSNGLLLANKSLNFPIASKNYPYGAATQSNFTVWYGLMGFGGGSSQNNFYFGTPGTDQTSVDDIQTTATSAGVGDAVYIVGQTDYYGASKGYIARLPYNGSVPGTGDYGSSGEIHLRTSSYMSYTATSLTVTTPANTVSGTGFTNTTSTLTQTAGTDTYTLNIAT